MIGHGIRDIDKDFILSKVTDIELASFYIDGLSAIPELISSPLRQDIHPSFWVYSPDGIRVKWCDFGTGQYGGMLDFIEEKFHLSFQEALQKIMSDMPQFRANRISSTASTGKTVRIRSEKSEYKIRTMRRDWTQEDFEYWDSYGVPKNWLLHSDIYPVAFIFIISETGFIKTVKADKYAYTFIERKDGFCTEKVYQPFNKEGFKWRSGHDKSVWDLWTKLPKTGKKVIITSSRKDALCLWAQTGIPSVSLQGEGYEPKPQVVQELKNRFEKVYILFDNDQKGEQNYGRLDGKKLADMYNLIQIEIPSQYDCKDPSDLYHKYGGQTVKAVITNLLNKQNH